MSAERGGNKPQCGAWGEYATVKTRRMRYKALGCGSLRLGEPGSCEGALRLSPKARQPVADNPPLLPATLCTRYSLKYCVRAGRFLRRSYAI